MTIEEIEKENAVAAKLVELMKAHDWYYQYSDDHRAYTSGNEAEKVIRELATQLPQDIINLLWSKLAPKSFGFSRPTSKVK
jgi:hypothetical protein